ncbi:hypothetical protein BZL54_16875 [Burkholderia ubonensis subsp. mesacidophila]|uniref:Uncharacterized protein n=2 Tax=Burkholderia ubonensis TaxID=101571 RepID=A0A2A4FEV5_9BURK|nr:hypothetical protein BZL54_16875 [Burkholderia ubonensis subsp. mesacidophila]
MERAKRSAGGTGVVTAALMITAPYLGSCAPDDSGTTQTPAPASLASPVPASSARPATGARNVAERAEPPVRPPFDGEKVAAPLPARSAFRAPPFTLARRSAIAVWLDDRQLGGSFPAGTLADRPPLPNGPLPDERFDFFQPHRDGPVLSYAGVAASLGARAIDGARLARVAASDLPPLPGPAAVRWAGPADSPFYADQVADALARHAEFGGAPAQGEAGAVRTASFDAGDAAGAGLAGAPFYADQIAEARMRPLPDDALPQLTAWAADVVAPLVSRFSFDIPDPKPAASPSIALSTLGGEIAYHALSERRAAFTEPRVLAGLLDTLKPTLAALPMPVPAAGAVSTVVRGDALPAEARGGEAAFASRPLPTMHIAGLRQSLDGQWPVGPPMSASLDELAAQVASIGGHRQAPAVAGARAERMAALASPEWRVAMRVRTDAVPGASSGERSQFGRGARAKANGRVTEGLPTIVADTRSAPPSYEARATERPSVVSGLPSAVEIAAALVRPKAGGRASVASQKSYRMARDAVHAVDAGYDTGWRAATLTTVGRERYGSPHRGGAIYDNIMAPVAAAQDRTIKVDMPPRRAYGDVVTNVAVLASNGPSSEADQKRATTIGYVF